GRLGGAPLGGRIRLAVQHRRTIDRRVMRRPNRRPIARPRPAPRAAGSPLGRRRRSPRRRPMNPPTPPPPDLRPDPRAVFTEGRPLERGFFDRPSHEVAPDLLGKVIAHGPVAIRLTEVEAYGGPGEDPASHTYR